MLGICIKNPEKTPPVLLKEIVLWPDDIVKEHVTPSGYQYFIKRGESLLHLPAPVYTPGETYYLKEPYRVTDDKLTYPTTGDTTGFSNRATMPQRAARRWVKIISVNLRFAPNVLHKTSKGMREMNYQDTQQFERATMLQLPIQPLLVLCGVSACLLFLNH